ncbi:MAG TPA: hypothetical protein PKY59_13730 [Pyrinomonadaceae bacterium]|nr:hypothetical protein [Pyrinomonadaceae bacterium]
MKKITTILAVLVLSFSVAACMKSEAKVGEYVWENVTKAAAFRPNYNFPVFLVGGEMFALNEGGWFSKDGKNWTKSAIPESGLNSAYQKYVQLNGAVYSLGAMSGNYEKFTIDTKILRTTDGKSWETVAEKSNLPQRVFYGAIVFKEKVWMIGGFDGKKYHNDVWNSADGVNWMQVTKKAEFSERTISKIVVFKDKIWIFGGGVIDGEKTNNPNSENEIWSSENGINWTKHEAKAENKLAGSPIVFDGKLWLVGANRNDGNFGNAFMISGDGVNWKSQSAPWSPRGGTVVWVFGDKLFMTGGKYSFVENGETKFAYSNDVWTLSKRQITN